MAAEDGQERVAISPAELGGRVVGEAALGKRHRTSFTSIKVSSMIDHLSPNINNRPGVR